jgi:hypothetical protein
VIYLDSSVVLSQLLVENQSPPDEITQASLTSSRLLEYEVWNRIHAKGLMRSHADEVQAILARIFFIELTPTVLAHALKPFPIPVRTLDGLHLATIEYLRARGEAVELASYDRRLLACAQAIGVTIYAL